VITTAKGVTKEGTGNYEFAIEDYNNAIGLYPD
jgi:hypothetical protein